MENATKALLIAGGVLIGVMLIAVLVYMVSNLSTISNSQEQAREAEQLQEFNKIYESYQKKKLRGSEVISLVNRSIDNNIQNSGIAEKQIAVYVTTIQNGEKVGDGLEIGTYCFTGTSRTLFENMVNDVEKRRKFSNGRNFECTKINYHSSNGRVSEIYFQEYTKASST